MGVEAAGAKKEEYVAKKPGAQQTKKEKRDLHIEPAPAGMSRRRFLTFLGTGSAALAAGSSGILAGCAKSEEEGAANKGASKEEAAQAPVGGDGKQPFFEPIEPSDADELALPGGFRYDIIRKWGDPVTQERDYGYNNDFVAYFPIDTLEGGENSEDGLLWVNHEYPVALFVSDYTDPDYETRKTPEQISKEKAATGASIFRVKKEGDAWKFVESDEYNRRLDATTPMKVTGPAVGSGEMRMRGKTEVIGTLDNCSGGVTPWHTVLTCEENFQYYYGESSEEVPKGEALAETYRWLDDPDAVQPPEHYGWVVEVDPFDKDSTPRKHTWLGRMRHECVAMRISDSGRIVAYTGHDEEDERIYKFVSSAKYDAENRKANLDLLTDGMLYVADFASGRWVALDYESNPLFKDNGFKSQADVLVRAPEAAAIEDPETELPIGTPMDRCEDIEVHPETGQVYCALTNNELHGNFYGQILRITEADDDPEATEFAYEVFAAGGPQTGFASPDNLAFDRADNLWVVTDISSDLLNSGIYEPFKNNGAFVMPSGLESGASGGDVFQFASGPVESELTGPYFTPDGKTLFLSVQHPGEESESKDEPTSTWPDGDIPRPAVVAITGFA